jgi:hypothetical protein
VTARRAAPGAGRRVRPVTGWRWWARANGCGARGSTAHSTWGCSHLLPLDAQGAASGAWRINADDELGTDREVPAGPRGRVQVAASRCCGDAPCCDQENHGLCDGLSTACEMCATCHCVPTGLPGCAPERPCHTSGGGSRHGDRRRQCLGARGNPSPYGLDRTVPSAARAKAARLLVQRVGAACDGNRRSGVPGDASVHCLRDGRNAHRLRPYGSEELHTRPGRRGGQRAAFGGRRHHGQEQHAGGPPGRPGRQPRVRPLVTPVGHGPYVGRVRRRRSSHFTGLYGYESTRRSIPLIGHVPYGPGPGRWTEADMACGGAQVRDPRDLVPILQAVVGPADHDVGFTCTLRLRARPDSLISGSQYGVRIRRASSTTTWRKPWRRRSVRRAAGPRS